MNQGRFGLTVMGTEVLSSAEAAYSCFSPTPSTFDRPFKIIVQKQCFLIDAEDLRKISPIFSLMCYGKDFDKMELSREIVDEKSNDIEIFLRAIHDHSVINVHTFPTILRLSNKYQVANVIEACENFVRRTDLSVLKPDEVLTILMSTHEFHSSKDVVVNLIRRLANEEKTVFNRLKLSRYLPAQIYGAVIGANLNICQIKEVEQMNGHWFKNVGSRTRWRRAPCDYCKQIMDCASCDCCRKTMCKGHTASNSCTSDYGTKMLQELKNNIVELEWE